MEPLERLQITPVAVAADDDQDVAVAEARPGRREVDTTHQQVAFVANVRDRVLGECSKKYFSI